MSVRQRVPSVWGARSKVAVLGVVASISLVLCVWLPFIFAFAMAMTICAFVWPPPERFASELEEKQMARAAWCAHFQRAATRPTIPLRLGPGPGCDSQHQPNPTNPNPPTRYAPLALSAFTGIWLGMVSVILEAMISRWLSLPTTPALAFIDANESLPSWISFKERRTYVTMPASFLVTFWLTQCWAYARRMVAFIDANDGMGYREAPPAAVVQGSLVKFVRRGILNRWSLVVLVPLASIATTGAITLQIQNYVNWWFVGLVPILSTPRLFKDMSRSEQEQRDAWEEIELEHLEWIKRWVGIKGLSIDENRVPLLHSVATYPESVPESERTFVQMLWVLRPGTQFNDFANTRMQLSTSLGKTHLVVEKAARSTGFEQLSAFIVSYEADNTRWSLSPHLDPNLDIETLVFAVRAAVIPAFTKLKLHIPLCVTAARITEPGTPQIVISEWALSEGDMIDDVAGLTLQFKELLRCEWARPFRNPSNNYFGLIFGVRPEDARFADRADYWNHRTTEIDWEFLYREVKLLGSNSRPPQLTDTEEMALGLKELTFRYPPAIHADRVEGKISALQSLSGYAHIEFIEYGADATQFKLRVGTEDPLKKVYFLKKYKEQLLRKPKKGKPYTRWGIGMTSSGDINYHEWEGEEPHLLIAGSSGCGKSCVLDAMMVQMLHNSDPEDVNFWLVEPKTGLNAYRHMPHVTRYLDLTVTPSSPHAALVMLLTEARDEMVRRNEAFTQHPAGPQKLSEARALAQKDPEGSGHLNFPYLFIVIEECSVYFGRPLAEDKEAHGEIMGLVQRLARESRSSGIFLTVLTQYPTKENIPTTLSGQCGKIGMMVDKQVASQVIIGRGGLEKIDLVGRGLAKDKSGKYQPFRGFLLDRDEDNGIDDRGDIVKKLGIDTTWPKVPDGLPISKENASSIKRRVMEAAEKLRPLVDKEETSSNEHDANAHIEMPKDDSKPSNTPPIIEMDESEIVLVPNKEHIDSNNSNSTLQPVVGLLPEQEEVDEIAAESQRNGAPTKVSEEVAAHPAGGASPTALQQWSHPYLPPSRTHQPWHCQACDDTHFYTSTFTKGYWQKYHYLRNEYHALASGSDYFAAFLP